MGAHAGPSMMGTLFASCGLRSLRVTLSPVHIPAGVLGSRVQRRLELLLQENSPKCPQVSFSFWENPLAHSCRSIQGRACSLTQPTSPTRQGTVRVRAPHGPTLNCPQSAPTVSVILPLHPYSPPCDFKQPGLSQCCSSLVWHGRELLTWLSLVSLLFR